jgi:hypothetical protein
MLCYAQNNARAGRAEHGAEIAIGVAHKIVHAQKQGGRPTKCTRTNLRRRGREGLW